MTLNELSIEILAKRALTNYDSVKLVDWALDVLDLGYESENLYILAGLGFDTREEREEYFWRCVKDLKLDFEQTEEKLIEEYALIIANKAIQKKISIDYAFNQMLKIVSATGYESRYMAFDEIDEDLDYLKYNNSVLLNSGLTIENSAEFILEEFQIFIAMENLKIPIEERNKCYCQNCNKLNKPILKNKFQLKKPFKYSTWICNICGSEELKFSNNHDVKKMIIETYQNNYG